MSKKELAISDPRINERIRVPEVRLVGPAGEQVGVVRVEDALRLAREADLDLVEVAPGSKPPVVKIMDYGKFKYEQAQKAKEARRNQANTVLKEVRFRLKIDEHDYETKRKRAEGFLRDGDKVKAMILFRGREQSRPEQGVRLLQRFAEEIREFGVVESSPTIDGRNMTMIIGPVRSKSDAKAEQNAQRQAQRAEEQERRRASAERQAERQAAAEAARGIVHPTTPVVRAPRVDASTEQSSRSSASRSGSRSAAPRAGAPRTGGASAASRAAGAPRPASASRTPSASSESGASSSAAGASVTPRQVRPTPASAPKPSGAASARPAAPKSSAAGSAKPAAPKPGAAPKPAAKPAASSAAKPAAKPASPDAAKPAPKPASE